MKLKCGCVVATSKNTASVRKGFEMGGYVKDWCEKHDGRANRSALDLANNLANKEPAMDVNVHDAKSQLSKLIERAMAGEDVVIARRGKPMVRLVPVEQKSTVSDLFGCMRDEIDYIEGWDAPLDDEALAAFYEDNLG